MCQGHRDAAGTATYDQASVVLVVSSVKVIYFLLYSNDSSCVSFHLHSTFDRTCQAKNSRVHFIMCSSSVLGANTSSHISLVYKPT